MAAPENPDVHLETMETTPNESPKPDKARYAAVDGTPERLLAERLLGGCRKRHSPTYDNERETRSSRIFLYLGLLRVPALIRLNRRVPNGTHGGVRGRRLITASYSIWF